MFNVLEINVEGFCSEAAGILQIFGWVLTIFKIAIPLLVIIYGIFDFGKAVTAGKDEEIKKSVKSLMWRAIAGIVIFFVPTIVMWIFGAISEYNKVASGTRDNFKYCETCVLRPWECN